MTTQLMERICDRANLNQAYKKVKANGGAPGIDGMNIEQLGPWIRDHKKELVGSLLSGSYRPKPVRGVKIPKPGGGKRQLGIPTVLDRLIQQAILQVLQPIYEPTFSDSSYGFRPGRSAHQALRKACEYVRDEKTVVVDLDLEKFFDRVSHDILMSRLARRIGDKRLLRLIRRFLEAGILEQGICLARQEGTPQGGPLSPLLANILLDDLDRELERRGHRFCRYADDCNIYVGSEAAGERVMASISSFIEGKLKLRVNREKSAVAKVWERKFLGHRILPKGKLGIAPKSLDAMKERVRQLTRGNRGKELSFVVSELNRFLGGWVVYYREARIATHLTHLDRWVRQRLRCYRLKQWKHSGKIARELTHLGVPRSTAWWIAKEIRGWWARADSEAAREAMGIAWSERIGLINLSQRFAELKP